MLAAGSLNRRITIQQRQTGADDAGQPFMNWQDVVTVWANIAGQTGMGTIKNSGDVTASIKGYSFRIRYLEGLNEGMRVLLDGQPFDVQAIRMDYAGREWTDIVCQAGGNDG